MIRVKHIILVLCWLFGDFSVADAMYAPVVL